MTPDQTLKAALVGDAPPKRAKPVKALRKPREERPRRSSWVFRWGVKLMLLALMLMITRGLLRMPEVKLMLADVQTAVIELVRKERAARDAAAAAEQVAEAASEDKATAAGTQMPENRVTVRRVGAAPAARVLSGPVDAVFAGSVLQVAGVPVVVDKLICPEPTTDKGERAKAALERLTLGQTVLCSVTGQAGKFAVKADCQMPGGLDLANAMQVDRLCETG